MNMERIRQLVKIATTLSYPDSQNEEVMARRRERQNAKARLKRRSIQSNGKVKS